MGADAAYFPETFLGVVQELLLLQRELSGSLSVVSRQLSFATEMTQLFLDAPLRAQLTNWQKRSHSELVINNGRKRPS